jgi:hypothetical protein
MRAKRFNSGLHDSIKLILISARPPKNQLSIAPEAIARKTTFN